MNTKQKRAIWYSERKRKLRKLEKLGLMREYLLYKGTSRYNKIERFCRMKGVRL